MKSKGKFGCRMLASVLLSAFVVTGCGSVRTANPLAVYVRGQTQIEQRLQEVFAAAASTDFDRLESYHLYGSEFTKFSGSSSERLDAAAG